MKVDPLVTEEVTAFLAARLVGRAGDNGRSSDAMIAAAVAGVAPSAEQFPADSGDLIRCFDAYKHAPPDLRYRLLPILEVYVEHIRSLAETQGTVSAAAVCPPRARGERG